MSTEAGYQYHSISSHLFVLVNSPNFSACSKPHNITFHLIPDPHKWNKAKQRIPTHLCEWMHDPPPLRPRESSCQWSSCQWLSRENSGGPRFNGSHNACRPKTLSP